MRPDDFFIDVGEPGLFGPERVFNVDLITELRRTPLADRDDMEVAVPLARLVHDDLERYGTGGGQELSEEHMREALRTLRIVVDRLGITGFEVPFRDYSTFRSWWLRNDGYGSWQARRDLLAGVFDSLHDQLADMEQRSLTATLVDPISPHARTGWPAVDAEISELRRHFNVARTPQDYRAVGLDCVAVTEALSGTVYDPARHLRDGEEGRELISRVGRHDQGAWIGLFTWRSNWRSPQALLL